MEPSVNKPCRPVQHEKHNSPLQFPPVKPRVDFFFKYRPTGHDDQIYWNDSNLKILTKHPITLLGQPKLT